MTRLYWVALACVVAVGVTARLTPWALVFTPQGIRFIPDGDACYHALRARVLAQEHRVLWRDPGLSYPAGADVPWPPLLDVLVAVPAWIADGWTPSNEVVERAAALLPVALAALGLLAAALLAREAMGRRGALACALLLAFVPVHVSYSTVGRADHHVLEGLLLTALLALYARALRRRDRPGWGSALAFGALLTAAFWSWVGSTLHVVLLGILVFGAHVLSRRDGGPRAVRLVGGGTAAAAVLTGATFALFGPPGALERISLGGVSALPVLVSAGAALWCAALHAAVRLRPDAAPLRRAVEGVVAAAVVVAGALLAVPALRAAVAHGLRAAGHGGEWGFILETQSLFASSVSIGDKARMVFSNLGLLPVLALAGIPELRRWWLDPERRPMAVLVGVLGLVLAPLAAHMSRFGYYAAIPLSVFGAMGLATIARAAARYGPRAVTATTVSAALVGIGSTLPGIQGTTNPVARLDAIVRVVAPLGDGTLPGDGALLVRWDEGHHARYYSGRPVVASPFGADIGRDAMADAAAFFLAEGPEAAEEILARRGVRWIVVDDPASTALEAFSFVGGTAPPVTKAYDSVRGDYIHCDDSFDWLVAARLFYEAGSASPANPIALGVYRLVGEVGPRGGPPTARLFEVVKGALVTLSGAPAAGLVAVTVPVTTPLGEFAWRATAQANAAGEATLRLPFATGRRGTTFTRPYVATDGSRQVGFAATEEQVVGGARLVVDFSQGW